MDWSINIIGENELTKVVDIHLESLPEDVMPSLGRDALKKYYEKVVSDKMQMLFGAFLEDQLVGFCLISSKPVGYLRSIVNLNGLIALCRLVLLQPDRLYLGIMQFIRKEDLEHDAAEILFIAVSPKYQGNSIGRELISYGVQCCFNRGIKFIQTKTANELLLSYYIREYSADILSSYNLCGRRYTEVRWAALPKGENECPA